MRLDLPLPHSVNLTERKGGPPRLKLCRVSPRPGAETKRQLPAGWGGGLKPLCLWGPSW